MGDIIRVFRVLEYVGEREKVEKTIKNSIHGEKSVDGMTIKAATLGTYPEIIKKDIGFSKGYEKGYDKGFDRGKEYAKLTN